jgi:hypothetical protein
VLCPEANAMDRDHCENLKISYLKAVLSVETALAYDPVT